MPLIYNGVTVEKVVYNGTEIDTVVYNGVTVFESKPQLPAPQNVTADGTVVSWDEVENAAEYEVFADGASIGTVRNSETWVLNEMITDDLAITNINFTSNNTLYGKIGADFDTTIPSFGQGIFYGETRVFVGAQGSRAWTDQAYRTITFETAPTGDLLAWLQANGVKQ